MFTEGRSCATKPRPAGRVLKWTAGATFLGALVACGPEPRPTAPRSSLLEAVVGRPTYRSPARWRYHPEKQAQMLARVELKGGGALLAGRRGERWVVRGREVRAAARLAPEDIVAVLRGSGRSWLFVGASGTAYRAEEPLGPFVRASAPLDRLARVTAAASSVVGVRVDGRLVRSDDGGAVWELVGPANARFVDVMLDHHGSGFALSIPESIWRTVDAGATWKRIDTPTFGALGLAEDQREGVVVASALGTRRWDRASSTFRDLRRGVIRPKYQLAGKPPRGPDAAAITGGRAFVDSGRYVEVVRAPDSRDGWELLQGPLDGKLKTKPLDLRASCDAVRVNGFEQWMYLACTRSVSGNTHEVDFYRSANRGRSFRREAYSTYARLEDLSFAVGHEGALVVTGVCAKKIRGCRPLGVRYRRVARERTKRAGKRAEDTPGVKRAEKKGAFELALSATPALQGSARALAFSADGRLAYAIGTRTKNGAYAVFVSRDGAATFTAHEIEQLRMTEEPEEPGHRSWERPARARRAVRAVAAEDGALAIVLDRSGDSTLVVTDEEGRTIGMSGAPVPGARIGAVGTRAVAIHPQRREVWESSDGGGSWQPIGQLPVDLCEKSGACEPSLACYVSGCVVGSQLSRIGWRGQANGGTAMLPPDDQRHDVYDRRVGIPLSCALGPDPWVALGPLARLPRASQASLGGADWFAGVADQNSASVTMLHGIGGAHHRVRRISLLAPVQNPAVQAFAYHPQVEGGVAIRYPLPSHGAGIRHVEVAWDNLVEGKMGRGVLADGGQYRPGDYATSGHLARRAQPDLVSITSGGAHLRLHRHARDHQPTYYLNGRVVDSVPPVSWPSSSTTVRFTDMMRIHGASVPVRALREGAAIIRGRWEGAGWRFEAVTTGFAHPDAFEIRQGMDIAYLGRRPGIHVVLRHEHAARAKAAFYAFRADGSVLEASLPVPTQGDLSDPPRKCSKHLRETTPRVVAEYLSGTRHPIVVTDPMEPMRVLITGGAVMYGTPDSPCVAAFEAEVVPTEDSAREERAIISLDDLRQAWMFHWTTTPAGVRVAEYRVMSCRFDPTLEVPPEVFRMDGTLVRRR